MKIPIVGSSELLQTTITQIPEIQRLLGMSIAKPKLDDSRSTTAELSVDASIVKREDCLREDRRAERLQNERDRSRERKEKRRKEYESEKERSERKEWERRREREKAEAEAREWEKEKERREKKARDERRELEREVMRRKLEREQSGKPARPMS